MSKSRLKRIAIQKSEHPRDRADRDETLMLAEEMLEMAKADGIEINNDEDAVAVLRSLLPNKFPSDTHAREAIEQL